MHLGGREVLLIKLRFVCVCGRGIESLDETYHCLQPMFCWGVVDNRVSLHTGSGAQKQICLCGCPNRIALAMLLAAGSTAGAIPGFSPLLEHLEPLVPGTGYQLVPAAPVFQARPVG